MSKSIYSMSIPHQIRRIAEGANGHRVAFSVGSESLTFLELERLSNIVAHHLSQKKAFKAEDVVILSAERSAYLVVCMLGILKAGGVCLPLEPDTSEERARIILEESGATICLIDKPNQFSHLLSSEAINCSKELTGKSDPIRISENDGAFLIYTSGSTGRPKGVLIEHVNISSRVASLQKYFDFSSQDRMIHLFPLSFVGGILSLWWPLLGEIGLEVIENLRDIGKIVDVIREKSVTVLRGTPGILEAILDSEDVSKMTSVRAAIFTGQALDPRMVQKCGRLPSCKMVYNAYGQTEAGPSALIMEINEKDFANPELKIVLGKPVQDVKLYLLDSNAQLIEKPGVVGEISIGGPCISRGYYGRLELTKEKFFDDPFITKEGDGPHRLYKTGDLARWNENGLLELCGRADDQIKIRGFRVEPGEISAVIKQQNGIKDALVLKQTSKSGQDILVAYVVPMLAMSDKEKTSKLRGELMRVASAALPNYMVPNAIVLLQKFPLTANGKVDKRALPIPEREDIATGHLVAPRNELESQILDLFGKTLNLKTSEIGVTDDFFQLGGDSLSFARVVSRARSLGIRIAPQSIYTNRTVETLAMVVEKVVVEKEKTEESLGASSGIVPLLYVPSGLLKMYPSQKGKAMTVLLRAKAPVERERLKKALQLVVKRQESLRSCIVTTDKGPQQKIFPYAEVPLHWYDFTHVPEAERLEIIKEQCMSLTESIDCLEGTPTFAVGLFQLPDEQWLYAGISTVFADDAALYIFLDELKSAYDGSLSSGVLSYKKWVEACQWYATSEAWPREREFYEKQLAHFRDHPLKWNENKNHSAVEKRYSKEVYHRADWVDSLMEVPRKFNVEIHELILSAYIKMLTEMTGQSGIPMRFISHGREVLRDDCEFVGQTMGCLTSRIPVFFEVGGLPAHSLVEKVRNEIRMLPLKGVGFGIFRAFRPEWKAPATILGDVAGFVYEGKVDFEPYGWEAPLPDYALKAGTEWLWKKQGAIMNAFANIPPDIKSELGAPVLRCSLIRSEGKFILKARFMCYSSSLQESDIVKMSSEFPRYLQDLMADLEKRQLGKAA